MIAAIFRWQLIQLGSLAAAGEIAPGTNLQSGSIFVSLGETFRREGRNVVDNLLPLTALLLKGQSYCETPASKIWPPAQDPGRNCIRAILASDQRKENTRAMLKFGLIAG